MSGDELDADVIARQEREIRRLQSVIKSMRLSGQMLLSALNQHMDVEEEYSHACLWFRGPLFFVDKDGMPESVDTDNDTEARTGEDGA